MFGYTAIIGDLVFKTARIDNIPEVHRESGVQFRRDSLEREFKILRHLKGKGLPVPEFIGEGHDPPYFCMARKSGIRLEREALDKMTVPEWRQIARDLAGFMAALTKAVSPEEAKSMGFGTGSMDAVFNKIEHFRAALDDPAVAAALGNNLPFCRDMQTELVKKYEEEYKHLQKVFCHGDFHPGNILHDPETKRIDGKTGCVIDLGLCHYDLQAENCSRLLNYYTDDFVAMVCDEYSSLTGEKLSLEDAKIFRCAALVSHVKQALEGKEKETRDRLPNRLEQIAKLRNSEDVRKKVSSERSRSHSPKR